MSGAAPAEAFALPVKVYYEDTDAAGVVYYANYLRFMERARTEWLAHLGLPLAALVAHHGVAFVVRQVHIDYHLPARLGDTLAVTVEPLACGAAQLVLRQSVRRDASVLCSAQVTLVCVDVARLKPRRLPGGLAAALGGRTPAAPGARARAARGVRAATAPETPE